MSVAIIQIGEHRATIDGSAEMWACPTDPPTAKKLNEWMHGKRSYHPDPLDFYATEAVKQFGGSVIHVDHVQYTFDPNVIY